MERVFSTDRAKVSDYHISVLPEEAIGFLNVRPGKKYIDCTLGGGGHTRAILEKGGEVLGIDRDKDAIDNFKIKDQRSKIKKGNFRDLKEIAVANGFNHVDGVLYDLGVSTHQLKTEGRGFSFGTDDSLDMRMDKTEGLTAKEVINKFTKEELYEIFTKYGEEKLAWSIADAVISARRVRPVETTKQLAEIILSVRGKIGKFDRTHPATRVFQALRIFVNSELDSLRESLPQAVEILNKEGRLVVISFHSLEDRIVKNFIRDNLKNLTKKPIRPTDEETKNNLRARSGKLRAAEKL